MFDIIVSIVSFILTVIFVVGYVLGTLTGALFMYIWPMPLREGRRIVKEFKKRG